MADNRLTVTVDGKDNLSSELKRIESGVIRFVGAISSALAAISVIAFPVLESARFQKELLETGKTTDYTKDQLMVLKQGLVDLSTQINVSAVDLAKISTMGGQLGIGEGGNVGGLLTFVQEISTAVTALDVSAEEAVTSIGKLINIFNVPASQYRNLVSALNEVSNKSNATATELFDVTRRIGNLGGSVNIPEAAALSASMIDLGLTAETAGTTVTKIFADMKSKAQEFSNFVGEDMTQAKWVDMLQGRGLKALDVYLDKLNSIPPAAAAAAKIDLTGGGRIFEAVTKLQQQRERQVALESRALRDQQKLDANRVSMTDDQVKAAEKQIAELQKQAKSVNVVTRLLGAAEEGYMSGTSAMTEQQTVLSGLSAQWVVFTNNIKKAAMGFGDVALLPLTDLLRNMSAAMQGTDIGSQLGAGLRDILDVMRSVTDALAFFTQGIQNLSSGVDWGAALKIGALLAAVTVFRALGNMIAGLGAQMLGAIPGVSALGRMLFGTSQAANAAATATNNAANSTQRVGGVFQTAGNALAGFATRLVQVDALYGQLARQEQQLAAAQAAHAAQLQTISNAYGQLGRRLQTRAALENSIAAAIARRDAAQAAGNNRGVATNNRVIAQQQAVLNQIVALEGAAAATAGTIARLTTQMNGASQSITRLSTGAIGLVEAFRAAREAGLGLGAALAVAFQAAASGNAAASWATSVRTAIASATASVVNFGSTARLAFQVGAQGATGFRGVLAGLQNAATVLGYVLRTALSNGISTGIAQAGTALRSLRGWILQTALAAAGLGAEWAAATSRMAQGALIATAAVRGLARAVVMLRTAMMSIINIAFFALLIKDALEFLGLWGVVTKAVENLFDKMSWDKAKIPDWLKTNKASDAATRATAEQEAAMKATEEAAGRYKEEIKGVVTLLRDAADAQKQLTFDKTNPTKSMDVLKEGVEALVISESKLAILRRDAQAQDKARLDLTGQLAAAAKRLDEARGGPNEKTAQRQYDNTAAALRSMTGALSKTREGIEYIAQDAPRAAENIAKAMLDASDASLVLARDVNTGRSALEDFAAAQAEVLRLQMKQDTIRKIDPAAYRAPTANTDGAARAEDIRNQLAAVESDLVQAQRNVQQFENSLRKSTPGNLALSETIKKLKEAADPAAIQGVAKAFTDAASKGFGEFSGKAIPKITATSLMDLGASKVVTTQLRDMYSSMATSAKNAAEQAKNALTQAMVEMKRATKEATDAVNDLNRAWQSAQQKAANYKPDQAMDKKLRERISVLDFEQKKEEEIANQRYAAGSDQLRRELLGIEEKYRKEKELATQAVDLSKAKRNAGQEVAEYERLRAAVQGYIADLEKANAIIKNPASSPTDVQAAIEAQKRLTIEGQDAFARMRAEAQKLAALDPIGDKLVITEEQKNKFVSDVGTMGKTIAGLGVDVAPALEGAYQKIAGQADQLAKGAQQTLEGINAGIQTYAAANGKAMSDVVSQITTAMAKTDEYKNKLAELSTTMATVKLTPGDLAPADLQAQADKIATELGAILAKNTSVSIPIQPDREKLKASFEEAFKDLTGDTATPKLAKIDAKLADGVTEAMTREIESKVKPKIDMEVNVKTNGSATVTDNAQRNARGGFIEALKSFANGGKVNGAGTGTSDSILSWLSNGEYVIDAMTTQRFGSKFFAGLQAAARTGNRGMLKLPAFASGGPVGTTYRGGVPEAVKQAGEGLQASRDTVNVNLTVGGQKLSLFAKKQEAVKVVSAFKNLEGT